MKTFPFFTFDVRFSILLGLALFACGGNLTSVATVDGGDGTDASGAGGAGGAGMPGLCSGDGVCMSPLVCAFGKCHVQCTSTRDCKQGERCVQVRDVQTGVLLGNVCQLPEESNCKFNSDCPGVEICGPDGRCRDECAADRDCIAGQVCMSHVCVDPEPPMVGTGGAGFGGRGGSAGAAGTTAGAGGSGRGGAGGSQVKDAGPVVEAGPKPDAPPGSSTLGAACKSNGECSAGLTCVRPTDNLSGTSASPGGVGNGICTVDCTATGICPSGGACVTLDAVVSKAACFESCAIGPAMPAPPVAKCHTREDVVCRSVNAAETIFACMPMCVTDNDCSGRKCDLAKGLCVDVVTQGKPLGSGCTAVANMSSGECAGGLCLAIDATADGGATPGICTSYCRLNTLEACQYRITPIDAGPTMGACVLPWADTGYNTGDLGLCIQLCDTEADCNYHASNWTCRTDIVLRGFGHSLCLVPPPG